MIPVLPYNVHRIKDVQCVINSSLNIFKVDFVRELLIKLKDLISNLGSSCHWPLSNFLEDRAAQEY